MNAYFNMELTGTEEPTVKINTNASRLEVLTMFTAMACHLQETEDADIEDLVDLSCRSQDIFEPIEKEKD